MFHFTNFGIFGDGLPRDIDGYVPEADDNDAFAFNVDHGGERTHDEDGNLTEYGEWWRDEGFPEWRAEAVKDTAQAEKALGNWRNNNAKH